ncbi:MAG TPA: hypothetical protein VF618_00425 [Thermoanaerobaculia bacterium]
MRSLPRLLLAFVLALLLPFPGAHIDRYNPVGALLLQRGALDAPGGFFVIVGILLAVYTAIMFGVLTLVMRRRRRA